MNLNPSKDELTVRIATLFRRLTQSGRRFDTAIIMDKINQYYFTGTMQDGLLILRNNGTAAYCVRRSFERARLESPLDCLFRISTYRDLLAYLPPNLGSTWLEMDAMPLSMLERLKKYFTFEEIQPIDRLIQDIRSVKSAYELVLIAESGRQNQILLAEIVPQILREGISEAEFQAELYSRMVKLGHHGVTRFNMLQMEVVVGQLGFGANSVYPTSFNGPGGMMGLSAAVPAIGNRERCLKKGDLVFVDVGYGFHGYHSDKTQVYSFGSEPSPEAAGIHQACWDLLNGLVSQMKPGAAPAAIYKTAMASLPASLGRNFMGAGEERVQFLGHGVGLYIDEMPVIARGFNDPLQANMVIALEPKCAIPGAGTVGVEETYLLTAEGPVCLTGGPGEIIVVS